jgi:4-amino-4-deoxy-L-arabinose transferase-like glycosyltransferase
MIRGKGVKFGGLKDEPGLNKFRAWHVLVLALLIAFALRFVLLLQPEVIHNDGTEYIRHAKAVLAGNWEAGMSGPVYPTLIALAYYTLIRNYELAGILVSVIFGTLLVLPVFYLGKEIFDERVGMLSSLVVAVQRFLHTPSGSVLTESTYHFFIATSVLFGWRAFKQGKYHHVLLFGLFVSLAYMTRPEGIGFLFVFFIWVLFVNPPEGKRGWKKRVGMILLAVFCFLLFSSPYLLQLRKEVGKWQISKKAFFSTQSLSEEEQTSLRALGVQRKINLLDLAKKPLVLILKIGGGLLKSFVGFYQVFNPVLFFLALLGWITIFKMKSSYIFKANSYILSHHVFFFAFVLPFFWIERRYVSQMISISIPWAALGCLEVAGWLHRWIEKERTRKAVSLILLLILLGGILIQGRVTHTRNIRVIRKEVGLWMKDHLPREAKMMSRFPQEAFYAKLPWVGIRAKSYEEILRKARSNEVRYLVIDESIEEDSPGFFEKIKKEDLVLLKEFKDNKGRRMVVFEIVYPEK